MRRKMSDYTRRGSTIFGLAIAATLALGASQASAQGLRFGGSQVQIYGGNGGYIGGGYRAGYPRRGPRVQVYRGGGHYDYHAPSVHLDPVYHPEYSHWTPLQGYHSHGHYDLVPHVTPGHYGYHDGPHFGGHHGGGHFGH
jgi:hypothetical protein